MIVFVATPLEAIAFPAPPTVPAPAALANAITVELSEVTVLPAASVIVAVSRRVAPEARSAVDPVSAIWVAAPCTTLNAPSVPAVRPAEVASIVTVPARSPVTVFVAIPPDAAALPVPPTVPVPDCCANAITVELSETTVFPAASRSVAVRTRVAPEVRFVVAPLSAICVAGPWTCTAVRMLVVFPTASVPVRTYS